MMDIDAYVYITSRLLILHGKFFYDIYSIIEVRKKNLNVKKSLQNQNRLYTSKHTSMLLSNR
jgi:hypothetical protein